MAQDGVRAGIEERCGFGGQRFEERVDDRQHRWQHVVQRARPQAMFVGATVDPEGAQL